MKDAYSLDLDEVGLDTQYRAHYEAYFKIFERCGLPVVAVAADVGMMGGYRSARVHVPVAARRGHSGAVRQLWLRAEPPGGDLPQASSGAGGASAARRVETPHATTIDELASS